MIPPSDFAARQGAVLASLASQKLDAALISAPASIRYLTGFTGSNALLLLAPARTVLFTDPRYAIQVEQEAHVPRKRVAKGALLPSAAKVIARRRFRTIGFEAGHLTFAAYQRAGSSLPARTSLLPLDDTLSRLRMIKSPAEIDLIRRSVLLNSQAFERAIRRVQPGVSECSLAAEIDHQMRRLGAEAPAFDTIVAFGPRAALPHATPTDRPLQLNELILIDMGAQRYGYSSDMTRVLFCGSPSARLRRMYDSVLEAQLEAVGAVRPGVTTGSLDACARKVLRRSGLHNLFTHSTGHGLGLEIHEPPRIGRRDRTRLEPGMVITIEPGVYREGDTGIRIEDTVLVTETGHEVLTPTTKELRLL